MPTHRLVQHWRSVATTLLVAGTTTLAFAIPAAAAPSSHDAASSPSSHSKSGTASTTGDPGQPQPQSNADKNTGGANGQCPGGPYCSTRHGAASGNGNQTQGNHTGEPCAGCVGKADNKNPKGQMPNGTDNNAGYECDRNHGIGRTNPAHTGCTTPPSTTPIPETNCTTNPPAGGCPGGSPSGCTPTALNHFCADVLGEKVTKTPTVTVPTKTKTTAVLGERVVRTPSTPNSLTALPHTGATIAPMLLLGSLALGLGSMALVASRRRRLS
jgi:LPXTG-motif cell wall-anchored protein